MENSNTNVWGGPPLVWSNIPHSASALLPTTRHSAIKRLRPSTSCTGSSSTVCDEKEEIYRLANSSLPTKWRSQLTCPDPTTTPHRRDGRCPRRQRRCIWTTAGPKSATTNENQVKSSAGRARPAANRYIHQRRFSWAKKESHKVEPISRASTNYFSIQ